MSIFNGVAGNRGHNPIGAVIHNDAGSQKCECSALSELASGNQSGKMDSHTIMCVRTEQSTQRMTGIVLGIVAMDGEITSFIP